MFDGLKGVYEISVAIPSVFDHIKLTIHTPCALKEREEREEREDREEREREREEDV